MPLNLTPLAHRTKPFEVTNLSATRRPHVSGEAESTDPSPADPDTGLPGMAEWEDDVHADPPFSVVLPFVENPTPADLPNTISHHLVLRQFQFDDTAGANETGGPIPSGRTITGIRVTFMYRAAQTCGGQIDTTIVQLTADDVSRVGERRSSPSRWDDSDWQLFDSGRDGDTWDAGLTAAQVLTDTFGLVIQVRNAANQEEVTAVIKDVEITIWYSAS